MQVRSTFSEGLESELPSSLPQGYPFYATDTRRLFVGRGDGIVPIAVFSAYDEELRSRATDLESEIVRLDNHLKNRLGQIGEKNVDETNLGDGKMLYYDITDDNYKFIDPIHILSSSVSGDTTNQQITLKNVVATELEPYKVYIDIPLTVNFNRRPLEILKFLESQDNMITIAATYDNQEASQFIENQYILFDGSMKLQTKYSEDMSVVSSTDENTIYSSIPVNFNEFKLIEELQVITNNPADTIYTLLESGGVHYSFVDSRWKIVDSVTPTQIDFTTQGMTDLRVVTTPTTNASFILKEVRVEDTGLIFETTIDVNLFKKISNIKVRQ